MQPYIPPTAIKDLSNEIFGGATVTRSYTEADPDSYHSSRSLEPDPLYMGLRALFTAGPIGRLRSWLEQRAEKREDRRHGARGSEPSIHPVDRPGGVVIEEPRERDIAA